MNDLKHYKVGSKDINYEVDAKNPQIAIQDFFRRVVNGTIKWWDLGMIGEVTDRNMEEGAAIPFRTAPSLYNLSMIDFDTYRISTKQIYPDVTDDQLMALAVKDQWMTQTLKGQPRPQPLNTTSQ